MTPKKVSAIVVSVVMGIFLIISLFSMFEYLDASQVMVIQTPVSGKLNWYTTPGVKWQGFGKVTKYKKRDQFWFSALEDQGKKDDQSIPIRFNDGGKARISGSIAWEMPMGTEHLTSLHTKYSSHEAIAHQLIRTVIEKAVYMTGPLMSSMESYAARRNELLSLIDDQIIHGVFKTESKQERVKDTMTGIDKTVTVVQLVKGSDGKLLRQDVSPLDEFGIKTFNLAINRVPYDEDVEKQIKNQQDAFMQVQTAIAKAKEAEQQAITAEKNGQAEAAKAKWDQEVIKAKEVTLAQQKLEVARLDAQAAEQFKKAETLRGEGEGARRRLAMQADGALDKKLQTYLEVNKLYADAVKHYGGNWVPSIVMGGGAGNQVAGGGANQLIDLLTAKTARDLGLDLHVPKGAKGAKVEE